MYAAAPNANNNFVIGYDNAVTQRNRNLSHLLADNPQVYNTLLRLDMEKVLNEEPVKQERYLQDI